MTQKSSGGFSLRKALVRRIAQAVNEYEKEANRPLQKTDGTGTAPPSATVPAEPAGDETRPAPADEG